MGTTKYETNCKRIRLKNIYIETADLPVQKSVSIMTDQIISVSFLAMLHRLYSIAYILYRLYIMTRALVNNNLLF